MALVRQVLKMRWLDPTVRLAQPAAPRLAAEGAQALRMRRPEAPQQARAAQLTRPKPELAAASLQAPESQVLPQAVVSLLQSQRLAARPLRL